MIWGRNAPISFKWRIITMMVLKVNDKEYTLRFGMQASLHKDLVDKMFKVLTGAYIMEAQSNNESNNMVSALLNGSSKMIADVPEICVIAVHAGLQKEHKTTEQESYNILEEYMEQGGKSFATLFEEIKKAMEDDGFFDLSGLTDMIQKMSQSIENSAEEVKEKAKAIKTPQDHKPKAGKK